jgi:hypothetical protein
MSGGHHQPTASEDDATTLPSQTTTRATRALTSSKQRIKPFRPTTRSQHGHEHSTGQRSRHSDQTAAASTLAANSLNSYRRRAPNAASPRTTPLSTMEWRNRSTAVSWNKSGPCYTSPASRKHSRPKRSTLQSGSRTAPPPRP